jgi:MYXO-CTERM domain-containing protein
MAEGASGGSVLGDLGFLERQYQVNEDDREGLRFLYPDLSGGDDVAIQSYYTPDDDTLHLDGTYCWQYVGERSRPSPYTQLIRLDGSEWGCDTPLETSVPVPLPVYPTQTIEATFSLLNLGTTDRAAVAWKVYLSTTDSVTASSTLVATYSSGLSVDLPYERPTDVTIPSAMAPGTYYLIAVIDPAYAISELDETNNVAVWNQLVLVTALPECGCSSGTGSVGLFGAAVGLLFVLRRRQ